MATAPANFGVYSNDVLIGNFNDASYGYILAYDPTTGAFLGALDENGQKIVLAWGSGRFSSAVAVTSAPPTSSISPPGSAASSTGSSGRSRPYRNRGRGS